MLKQRSVQIGDDEVVIEQLPATRGLEVGIQLVKIMMGASEGIGGVRGDGDLLDAEYNPAQMVNGMMSRLDIKGTPQFIKTLVKESVILAGENTDQFETWYETRFAARHDDLVDLLIGIIEHNGYVELLKKRAEQAMRVFFTESTVEKESTPSS